MDFVIRKIVIFKATDIDGGSDPYEQKFVEAGLNPNIIPPIDFEFCNLDLLREKLNYPNSFSGIKITALKVFSWFLSRTLIIFAILFLNSGYAILYLTAILGIIFTSPRAVKAVSSCFSKESLPTEWNSLPMFVVGEGTCQCLFSQLGLQSEGKERGSAKELAAQISGRNFDKSLLFPCGNLKTEVLSSLLKEKGIFVEEVTVYRTCQHPMLDSNIHEVIKQGLPECIIFFSPSGVKYTVPLLKSYLVPMEKIKFVCIGPSTAAALREHSIPIWATAEKPNPTSLTEAVFNAEQLLQSPIMK